MIVFCEFWILYIWGLFFCYHSREFPSRIAKPPMKTRVPSLQFMELVVDMSISAYIQRSTPCHSQNVLAVLAADARTQSPRHLEGYISGNTADIFIWMSPGEAGISLSHYNLAFWFVSSVNFIPYLWEQIQYKTTSSEGHWKPLSPRMITFVHVPTPPLPPSLSPSWKGIYFSAITLLGGAKVVWF